jgi:solute carrier family 9B (sodium/hydrogen exchanger), member 1/2
LAAVSPAIIIPKMLKMIEEKEGANKLIPQMIMAGTSVDDIFVIVLFTSFIPIAQQGQFQLGNLFNLPLAISLGIGVGVTAGFIFVWFFKKFHLRDTSKVLIILSFGLFF